jgi:hypothetical protein
MSVHDHSRFKVVSETQHLYEHGLEEFPYSHPALPGNGTAQSAFDYIFNVLYPKVKGEVATPADLPTGVDTPNVGDLPPEIGDQRLVADDGDGNYAMYIYDKWDGQASAQWNKIADYDFGENSIVQALLDQTQYLYVRKFGTTDYDPLTELPLAGQDAGQHIYGGDTSGQNLILHANNGDDPGVRTGVIYLDDDTAPYIDLGLDFGTATRRWENGYFGTLVVGTATMTITSNGVQGSITDTNGIISFDDENLITTGNIDGATITASTNLVVDDSINQLSIGIGSITDTSGSISFGDENLSTTGTLAAGVTTVDGTLVLGTGSITDTTGSIDFDNENLSTTGNIDAATAFLDRLELDDLVLDGNAISIATLDTDLSLAANGTGVTALQSAATTGNVTTTGTLSVTGQIDVDSITLDATSISVAGNVLTVPSLIPDTATRNLGSAAARWQDLFLSNSINDGTNNFLVSDLMAMRLNIWRDIGKTQLAQNGDALFYDSANGVWLASAPDLEIDHGSIDGLGDDDHTQYALLAGRTGGQVLYGSDTTAESLDLRGNSVDDIGISIGSHVLPSGDGSVNLGSASFRFDDLYLTGEGIGFRAENEVVASMVSAAGTVGRLWYGTDTGFLHVDTGTEIKKVGNNSYAAVHTNVQIEAGIDVSASIDDARDAVWQVREESTGDVLDIPINTTATTVTAINDIALPAGNYRLVGVEA